MAELALGFTACPECGALAEVVDRDVWDSTDGSIEHVKVLCIYRHNFYMPTERMAS